MDLLSSASRAWVLSLQNTDLTFSFAVVAKANKYWPHCETSGLNVTETHFSEFQEVY